MILTRSLGKNPCCKILEKILARSWQVLASDFSKIWRDSSDKILGKILARSWQVLASDFSKFDKILEGILAGILAGIPWKTRGHPYNRLHPHMSDPRVATLEWWHCHWN